MQKFSFYSRFSLFLIIVCGTCTYLGLKASLFFLNDRFAISHIETPPLFSYRIRPPTQQERNQIAKLCSAPFRYLGQGSQCYIFENGEIILKLVKFNRFRQIRLPLFEGLPSFLQKMHLAKQELKNKKWEAFFQSCKIAHQELFYETGMIFYHFYQGCELDLNVTLIDKLGRQYSIALDRTYFILQERGELIGPTFQTLINQEDFQGIKERMTQLITLLNTRFERGIADNDPALSKNAGYLKDRAIFLDIGGFSKDSSLKNKEIAQNELNQMILPLQTWLKHISYN
ncbi:MAG: hypothetical protein KDK55_02965 [Chlamydiia bacterium]|nr:hypothetical protein [Chlamydiia bacterium]